jgi:hypothetical protein
MVAELPADCRSVRNRGAGHYLGRSGRACRPASRPARTPLCARCRCPGQRDVGLTSSSKSPPRGRRGGPARRPARYAERRGRFWTSGLFKAAGRVPVGAWTGACGRAGVPGPHVRPGRVGTPDLWPACVRPQAGTYARGLQREPEPGPRRGPEANLQSRGHLSLAWASGPSLDEATPYTAPGLWGSMADPPQTQRYWSSRRHVFFDLGTTNREADAAGGAARRSRRETPPVSCERLVCPADAGQRAGLTFGRFALEWRRLPG